MTLSNDTANNFDIEMDQPSLSTKCNHLSFALNGARLNKLKYTKLTERMSKIKDVKSESGFSDDSKYSKILKSVKNRLTSKTSTNVSIDPEDSVEKSAVDTAWKHKFPERQSNVRSNKDTMISQRESHNRSGSRGWWSRV
ncbi:uncharacterized protein LOC126906935 isoform X2 [Daktulosphaira vitifoliae]|uniref:uncharacterized protein LOC126906935 isoform X2 n=1 Tax=Daktulosphaira vitifoliae TaxID=58002 RepID=UPI0021A9E81A|nr:uncharacterized protein LOC126906935 isoform X2 [Daktulosphaira vitifoliae]